VGLLAKLVVVCGPVIGLFAASACIPDLNILVSGYGGGHGSTSSAGGGTGGTSSSLATSSATGNGGEVSSSASTGDSSSTSTSSSAAASSVSSSSSAASSGSGGGSADDLIDDMEDDNGQIRAAPGRQGGKWGTQNDAAAGGVQEPVPNGVFLPVMIPSEMTHSGPVSHYAAHTDGMGYTWAQMYAVLVYPGFYDASKYAGIGFWMRTDQPGDVRVEIVDKNTDPSGNVCNNQPEGCYDAFGVSVTPTSQWVWTEIRWAQLTQRGFGYQISTGVEADAIVRIVWNLPGTAFDFWVDDVVFLAE
jgi:hypothetical protein